MRSIIGQALADTSADASSPPSIEARDSPCRIRGDNEQVRGHQPRAPYCQREMVGWLKGQRRCKLPYLVATTRCHQKALQSLE
nr:hypothetical protein CFP56_25727 [Quercus suber]